MLHMAALSARIHALRHRSVTDMHLNICNTLALTYLLCYVIDLLGIQVTIQKYSVYVKKR